MRFNPPPTWPTPPEGWTPQPGWCPDPSWAPAPEGWPLWVEDLAEAGAGPLPPRRRAKSLTASALAVVALLIVLAVVAGAEAVGGVLLLAGLAAFVVGGWALLRGRVSWARVHGRKAAGAVLTAGFVIMLVGAGLAPPPAAAPATAEAEPSPAAVGDATTPAAVTSTAVSSPSSAPSQLAAAPPTLVPSATVAPISAGEQAIEKAEGHTALAVLGTLAVKGRAPRTGYDRAAFGQAWADVDRNGCDTRNDVLRRDLTGYTLKSDTRGCLVLKGVLHDPYTGRTISFVRGEATSTAVQIDHVVALSDAWQKGAQRWETTEREAFANDSLNLLAVDGPSNSSKSDGDAATWLPPAKSYRCAYVSRQVAVKAKYGLWVTRAEREATARVLAGCRSLAVPTAEAFALGGGKVQPAARPQPGSTHEVTPPLTTAARTTAARTTKPKPTKTTSSSSVRAGVHPGAFCAPGGALGRTSTGTLMRCQTTATDDRNRWRRD